MHNGKKKKMNYARGSGISALFGGLALQARKTRGNALKMYLHNAGKGAKSFQRAEGINVALRRGGRGLALAGAAILGARAFRKAKPSRKV